MCDWPRPPVTALFNLHPLTLIDGISFEFPLPDNMPDFAAYMQAVPGIAWKTLKGAKDGDQLGRKYGDHRQQTRLYMAEISGFKLKAVETYYSALSGSECGERYKCKIIVESGSIHKYFRHGNNYCRFTHADLVDAVQQLQEVLRFDVSATKINSIEIGVNIELDFSPQRITRYIIRYGETTYNKNTRWEIGRVFKLDRYDVKCYDKGKQTNIDRHLMRFELHHKKMQALKKYKIETVADLTNAGKCCQLIGLLSEAWNKVLVFPVMATKNAVTPQKDRLFLGKWQAAEVWRDSTLSRPVLQRKKERIKKIDQYFGGGIHEHIGELIAKEWREIFATKAGTYVTGLAVIESEKQVTFATTVNDQKQVTFATTVNDQKQVTFATTVNDQKQVTFATTVNETSKGKGVTFAHIYGVCKRNPLEKITVERGTRDPRFLNADPLPAIRCDNYRFQGWQFYRAKDAVNEEPGRCKTCLKPLHPCQKPGSVFCSPKYVGEKAAKKCRNADSNPRNHRITKYGDTRGILDLFAGK